MNQNRIQQRDWGFFWQEGGGGESNQQILHGRVWVQFMEQHNEDKNVFVWFADSSCGLDQ